MNVPAALYPPHPRIIVKAPQAESRNLIHREIDRLKKELPVSPALLEQQDRPKVVRMATTFLRIRDYYEGKTLPANPDKKDLPDQYSLSLQCLDYFCFLLDGRGRVIYVSETVSTHLGYSQFQMFASSIAEFIHPEDFRVLSFIMDEKPRLEKPVETPTQLEMTMQVTARFRSKIPKRSAGFVHDGYKTIILNTFSRYMVEPDGSSRCTSLLATGIMLDRESYPEIPLSRNQFILRTAPDLCVMFADTACAFHLNCTAADVLDRSIYHLIHAGDEGHLHRAHISVCRSAETQSVSPYLRLLKRGGGHVFASLHLIKLPAQTATHPFSISIIFTVIGEEESPIVDVSQMTSERRSPPETVQNNNKELVGAHSSKYYSSVSRDHPGRHDMFGRKRRGTAYRNN